MRNNILHKYGLPIMLLIVLLSLVSSISSCGGGGGGGSGGGDGGISYTGLTTQASLTATNANKFFAVMWYQGASSATVSPKPSLSKAGPLEYSLDSEFMPYISRIGNRLLHDAVGYKNGSQTVNSAIPVNEIYYGSISGTLTITGSIDSNTLTGNLTITYVNYNDGDGTYDGVVSVRIDELTNTTIDMTMSFSLLTIKTASYDMSMSGSIRLQESTLTIRDTMTINVVTRDNANNEISRFDNYVLTMTYNSITNPTSGSETYSGRVYAGKYGYVDVSTISPCIYSNPQAVPDRGGPIVLSGAGNTKAHITPLSTSNVKIEVDDDGDGAFECENCHLWSDLDGPPIYSNATLTGTWMMKLNVGVDTVTTGLKFDGNGNIVEMEVADNPLSPSTFPSPYAVQSNGSFTLTWTFSGAPTMTFTGTLNSFTAGSVTAVDGNPVTGYLRKVTDLGACQGTWNGTLAGPFTNSFTIIVDNTGTITGGSGFTAPYSGKLFCESGDATGSLATLATYTPELDQIPNRDSRYRSDRYDKRKL